MTRSFRLFFLSPILVSHKLNLRFKTEAEAPNRRHRLWKGSRGNLSDKAWAAKEEIVLQKLIMFSVTKIIPFSFSKRKKEKGKKRSGTWVSGLSRRWGVLAAPRSPGDRSPPRMRRFPGCPAGGAARQRLAPRPARRGEVRAGPGTAGARLLR